jgi:hypothetical protein
VYVSVSQSKARSDLWCRLCTAEILSTLLVRYLPFICTQLRHISRLQAPGIGQDSKREVLAEHTVDPCTPTPNAAGSHLLKRSLDNDGTDAAIFDLHAQKGGKVNKEERARQASSKQACPHEVRGREEENGTARSSEHMPCKSSSKRSKHTVQSEQQITDDEVRVEFVTAKCSVHQILHDTA